MALLLVQQPETLFGCLDTLAEIVDVSHLAGDPLTFDPPRLAAKGKLFTNGNPLFNIGVKHRPRNAAPVEQRPQELRGLPSRVRKRAVWGKRGSVRVDLGG